MTEVIRTERLDLVPITLEVAEAALTNHDRLGNLIGAKVHPNWPNLDFAGALVFIRADLEANPPYEGWCRLIVDRRAQVVVGDAGFKSVPDPHGTVEMGYGIVPEHQGRGIATEASSALVEWARAKGVRVVTAECLVTNTESIRVLEKIRMQRTETVDSDEGEMIRWELRLHEAEPQS